MSTSRIVSPSMLAVAAPSEALSSRKRPTLRAPTSRISRSAMSAPTRIAPLPRFSKARLEKLR